MPFARPNLEFCSQIEAVPDPERIVVTSAISRPKNNAHYMKKRTPKFTAWELYRRSLTCHEAILAGTRAISTKPYELHAAHSGIRTAAADQESMV